MNTTHSSIVRFVGIACLVIGMLPFAASALSVQWNTNVPELLQFPDGVYNGAKCLPMLENAEASVAYSARAVDTSTGASVCGGTVAKGSSIRFEFIPPSSSDLYWFGTGFNWDSPYGDWVSGAAAPANLCDAKNLYATSPGNFYGSFSVNPPAKTIAVSGGAFTCAAPASDGSVTCTASTAGSATATFTAGSTSAHFYTETGPAPNQCTADYAVGSLMYTATTVVWPHDGTGWRYCYADGSGAVGDAYTPQVPAQTLSCPLTVVSASGSAPSSPSVAAGAGISGLNQCIVGSPYTITISSTDADNDQVKYGIDWDNNGTIDQFVPSSGYVASGVPQTASRTYSTEGAKTVQVIAMDSRGLTSGWTTFTTDCSNTPASDSSGSSGSGSGSGSGSSSSSGSSVNLNIRALPSLVPRGLTTHVSWAATNVASCTVRGSNGDGADGSAAWTGALSAAGGTETSAITSQTTYTLSCTGLDDSVLTQTATVNILPVFQEL